MNLRQVAKFLKEQGVINAINLDGGGSATYILNGSLASYPSDHWCVHALTYLECISQTIAYCFLCSVLVWDIKKINVDYFWQNLVWMWRCGAVRGPYPLCCVFMRGCASRRTAAGTDAALMAGASASGAGADLDVPISHARAQNVAITGSALRVSHYAALSHTFLYISDNGRFGV